jgi:hypothetical protein
MKYTIETQTGQKATLEGNTMIRLTEQARQFCHAHNEGWPGGVVVWDRLPDPAPTTKRGKKS